MGEEGKTAGKVVNGLLGLVCVWGKGRFSPLGLKTYTTGLGSKWIWKIKYKASSDIERYTTRLVAKDFGHTEGFDYDETFSRVIKMVIARCIIATAVDVYMTLPDGYNDENKSKVCKLNKSLYGLKQASRQWNAKLTTALAELGFEQSRFDYSLYTNHNGDEFIALLVYVDDIVITGNDDIGLIVENDFGLYITQRKYCLELLYEYGLLADRPIDIPLPENSVLSFKESANDIYLSDLLLIKS
uniref:Ribonuclease H-like domain-containing protein n=1 Tax=Tanacetum cinerariifolium TaxID=118510 RepID=A0A6L2NTV7_TANCI|nr:ribonuclease H-like domain-containing protein [Tanacetum cinerariifolium]